MTATSLLAILLMGAVTYATRAGGFWLARRLRPGPFLRAWLEHLPGAVFAALVAPMVVGAGPAGWLAAGAGFVAMRWTGQFLLAIVVGIAVYLLGQRLGLQARAKPFGSRRLVAEGSMGLDCMIVGLPQRHPPQDFHPRLPVTVTIAGRTTPWCRAAEIHLHVRGPDAPRAWRRGRGRHRRSAPARLPAHWSRRTGLDRGRR